MACGENMKTKFIIPDAQITEIKLVICFHVFTYAKVCPRTSLIPEFTTHRYEALDMKIRSMVYFVFSYYKIHLEGNTAYNLNFLRNYDNK